MRIKILLILLLVVTDSLFSQQTISGTILDADSGAPVDYVNIGVIGKAQGTVSDQDGGFNLTVQRANPNDTIQVSRIGYSPLKFSLQEFKQRISVDPILSMQKEFTELDEVVVDLRESKKNRIGINQVTKGLVAYWNNSKALGGEHASKIMVRRGPVKLEDLSFEIVKNISDSLLVRVNVYEIDKGLPGRNISRTNIMHMITKKSGRDIIDLSPYDIVVDDHFIIGLELLKVYGRQTGITIAAYSDGYRSYSRPISQDRWKRMRSGFSLAFNLNTSSVEKSTYAEANTKNKVQKPTELTILWDQSFSMQNRNLDKEFTYLDAFFDNLKNVTVRLQPFGYELGQDKVFHIKNGNWHNLKFYLQELINDGGTSWTVREKLRPESYTLIFTDGLDFFEDINRTWTGKIYTISSSNKANNELLATISDESGGSHIDLTTKHDLKVVADYKRMYGNYRSQLKKNILDSESDFISIQGYVSDFEDLLEGVSVQVKNSDNKVLTDAKGSFEILARAGETLVFSYPSRNNVEAVVSTGTKILTITMPMGVQVLDEVVLNENIKAAAYQKGVLKEKRKITTNYGILDPDKLGFAVRQLMQEDINPIYQTIWGAIAGKFPGVEVRGTKVFIRGGHRRLGPPVGAAWEIDGMTYPDTEPPEHIDINNVKSITVMPGSWAASKYGAVAVGGVVIVRTISNSFDNMQAGEDTLYDQAKLRDNYYKNEAVFPEDQTWQKPSYIRELDAAKSSEEAYSIYLQNRVNWGNQTEFFADVHDIFRKKFISYDKASKIVSNIQEISGDDINAMRLLAYKYDEQGLLENSLEIYKTITKLNPMELQSQRDLASAYVRTGYYQKAWDCYKEYLRMVKDSLSEDGLDQIVRQEMLEIVERYHEKINLKKSDFQFDKDKEDISIIVQWNNPNAEFELQFVGPTGQYFTWKHTELENAQLLAFERKSGSYARSFGIQDIGEGPWMINSRYLGNKENTPTYLKFTIRNNENMVNSVKVIKLRNNNVNYRALNISENEVISHFK